MRETKPVPGSLRFRNKEKKVKVVSLCKPRNWFCFTNCNAISEFSTKTERTVFW